ncbi:hypothetical protein ACFQFC_06240 [Amorphoplanes digitatis]|uniref:hypothetical protein n=1 Tax=Actinoplanes digitatis TaxID=1868 RepID=UPI003606DD96
MTDSIAGLPFWEITFDADGDPDGPGRDALLAEVPARGITDLFVFSHGWNNERRTARRLYNGFFGLLAGQLRATPADPPVVAGLAGVVWPSKRWSDEPIPDFGPATAAALPGAAAATEVAPAPADASSPTLDKQTLDDLRDTFPAATRALDRMAALLETEPTDAALAEFHSLLAEFTAASGAAQDDGEGDGAAAGPRMLVDAPERLFERYRDALRDAGVEIPGGSGGAAGLGDRLKGAWNGAKEALRQATYWEMKNRSGVVGRDGLGPALAALHGAAPGLRVHLIGHSFGARLVSYALAGLPGRPAHLPGQVPHAASGRVLPLRVRGSAAVRRRAAGRPRRPAAPGRRADHGVLLPARRRGGPLLPAGLVRRPRGQRRRERRHVPLGRHGRRRGAEPGRRAGRHRAGRVRVPVLGRPDPQHRRRRGGAPRRGADRCAQRHRAPRADLGGAGGQPRLTRRAVGYRSQHGRPRRGSR